HIPGRGLTTFCRTEIVCVGPPTCPAQGCKQGHHEQDPPSARLWLLGLKEGIQARERVVPQRVHPGLIRAGPIRVGLICVSSIQAQHRRTADRRHLSVCGPGCVHDERLQRFRRVGYSWCGRWRRVGEWGTRRPPSFQQGATHSAKAEIVRIVLTALRADHDGSPDVVSYSLTPAGDVIEFVCSY